MTTSAKYKNQHSNHSNLNTVQEYIIVRAKPVSYKGYSIYRNLFGFDIVKDGVRLFEMSDKSTLAGRKEAVENHIEGTHFTQAEDTPEVEETITEVETVEVEEVEEVETILEAAKDTAKKIRKELKKNFKDVKFKVKAKQHTCSDSVTITWTDGPIQEDVQKVTDRFVSSTTKGYEYEGKWYTSPSMIIVSREYSKELEVKVEEKCRKLYTDWDGLAVHEKSRRQFDMINKLAS
jgi:hypothetical protein